MDCLRDYIFVDWCGAVGTPPSGLYINSLPGISFKSLSALSDEEQVNFRDVWDNIQTRALKRLELDLRQKFGKAWKLKSILQSKNTGWKVDRTLPLSINNTSYYGFEVDLGSCNSEDDYMNSALFEMYLQQLFVYSVGAIVDQITTVKIFEMDSGSKIYQGSSTSTFAAEAWNKNEVNMNFIKERTSNDYPIFNNSERYIVTLDFGTAFSSYQLDPLTNDWCECCGFKVRPMNMTTKTGENILGKTINYTDYLSGISAIINSRCSWNRLVCSNKDVFATPLWYLLGIETMNEQLNSDRLNRYTTIDLKKAERRRKELEIMYMGGIERDEFGNFIKTMEGALTQAVDGIDLDCSDCCLECAGELKLMESTL